VITRTTAMNARRFLQAVSTLGAIGLALAQSTCDGQPPIRCIMQTSLSNDAIGRFTLVGMPSVVAGAPANACDFQRLGQGLPNLTLPGPKTSGPNPMLLLLGLETFSPSPTDPNQSKVPTALALKAEWIGDRIQDAQVNAATDTSLPAAQRAALANYPYVSGGEPPLPPADPTNVNRPYAFGTFDSVYPDSNGICKATLTASEMDYPDIPAHAVIVAIPADQSYVSGDPTMPGMQGDTPATHVRYEWTNVRAIVTTESLGVEAFANVSIARDGCKADYQVSILSPRVPCTALDSMGNALVPATGDQSLCNPNAAPKNPFGSGIHPGIPVRCDQVGDPKSPDFECMPTKTAP
jgi:hypothetical protein